jgi:long-chain acyl-CoA synthetase
MDFLTLSLLLSEQAKKYPKKTCIKYENRKISYSEINERVNVGAGGFVSAGLRPRERAAILMDNCPEYIVSYFSILRAGGIAVPLNTFLTANEIIYILKDSGCNFLVYSDTFSSHVEQITQNIPEVKAVTFCELPESHGSFEAGEDIDTAVLLYTSGTTGFPKGVMLSNRNLLTNAEACMKVMRLSAADRILLFLPLFHAFSFTVCVILPILSGATIVLLKSVKPFSKIIKSVIWDRITFFVAVPTIYNILSKKKVNVLLRFIFRFLLSVRACISGASALPERTIYEFEKKFRLPLIEGYGLTEASPVVAVNPLYGKRKPASVGPPIPGVKAALVDDEGQRMSVGERGELIVRGNNVMKGYYHKQEETEDVLRDGWLYTGDVARIDEEGYIYIIDRKKDLIIAAGMNIYPREVEEVVIQDPEVEECAMVGIPDGRGSEITALCVKKKEHALIDDDRIRKRLKGRVASYKIPKRIVFLEEFPKTATGKIKKNELRMWKF